MPLTAAFRRKSTCLLVRAWDDPDAFAEFYDAYAERVLVFFVRRLFDAEIALDLTSETFAKALERRRQFRGTTPEEEQAWLFAIARSELSHYWRRGQVERDALRRIGVPVPALNDADIERIEELADLGSLAPIVGTAIARLPSDQQDAVQRRVVCERSYAEIAADLGISQEVVRARVSRGLRALAAQLEADGVIEDAA